MGPQKDPNRPPSELKMSLSAASDVRALGELRASVPLLDLCTAGWSVLLLTIDLRVLSALSRVFEGVFSVVQGVLIPIQPALTRSACPGPPPSPLSPRSSLNDPEHRR